MHNIGRELLYVHPVYLINPKIKTTYRKSILACLKHAGLVQVYTPLERISMRCEQLHFDREPVVFKEMSDNYFRYDVIRKNVQRMPLCLMIFDRSRTIDLQSLICLKSRS